MTGYSEVARDNVVRTIIHDADNENLLAEVYEAKGMKSEAAEARRRAVQFKASH